MGPARAERIFTRFEAGGFSWTVLEAACPSERIVARSPIRFKYNCSASANTSRTSSASTHRQSAGDLVRSRKLPQPESFLTEMALDPPSATSDLGAPSWTRITQLSPSTGEGPGMDAVFLLNVADAQPPSEFSTGRPELIEEERRLFYVAMTRRPISTTGAASIT